MPRLGRAIFQFRRLLMEFETGLHPTASSRNEAGWERRYDATPFPSGLSLLETADCGQLGQTQMMLDVQAFNAKD